MKLWDRADDKRLFTKPVYFEHMHGLPAGGKKVV